jgi:hypothetical protein
VLAAGLTGGSTLALRRWGPGVGGALSAFPLVVGPVLWLAAERHGSEFAARAAAATLLGLVALSGFAVAYARSARRSTWWMSLACAWAVAGTLGALAGRLDVGVVGAVAAAVGSLLVARAVVPSAAAPNLVAVPAWELPLRMGCTGLLIVLLTAAAGRFGPAVAGVLASLPALASVLVVFTHLRHGRPALFGFLRGMLSGMGAFVAFCAVVAALVVPAGVVPAFLLATGAAVAVQAVAVRA